MSGTGALRLAADFLYNHMGTPSRAVLTSSPTWPNHFSIFRAAGFSNVNTYSESFKKLVVGRKAIVIENRHFLPRIYLWQKIEVWAKQSKFCKNVEILAENGKFRKKSKFWKKTKCSQKIVILTKI